MHAKTTRKGIHREFERNGVKMSEYIEEEIIEQETGGHLTATKPHISWHALLAWFSTCWGIFNLLIQLFGIG